MPAFPLRLKLPSTPAACYALILSACGAAFGGALVLQHGLGLEPCALCILQRWALLALAALAMAAWAMHRRGGRISGWIAAAPALACGAGLVVAGRHLWVQAFPAPTVGCGVGPGMLLEQLPLSEALPRLFAGSGSCATLERVLGVPLPLWAAVVFAGSLALVVRASMLRTSQQA